LNGRNYAPTPISHLEQSPSSRPSPTIRRPLAMDVLPASTTATTAVIQTVWARILGDRLGDHWRDHTGERLLTPADRQAGLSATTGRRQIDPCRPPRRRPMPNVRCMLPSFSIRQPLPRLNLLALVREGVGRPPAVRPGAGSLDR
jgi:hypothetical protein